MSVKTVRSDLGQGGAIDIDHRGRTIYWSDNARWTLNRMSLTSGETEVNVISFNDRNKVNSPFYSCVLSCEAFEQERG